MPPAWDWDAVARYCLRQAARWTPEGEDPQDVAQEAVIRAWRMRHQCASPDRPWPWLARICQREAARVWQRRASAPRADEHEPTVSSAVDETVERLAMRAAVADLATIDRELIRLRYDEDQTYDRIASVLDMPEGTVKVRLHRARRRLRQVLGDDY
jgi:RNA polymerase sigma-70 factor (ECF subfamily)